VGGEAGSGQRDRSGNAAIPGIGRSLALPRPADYAWLAVLAGPPISDCLDEKSKSVGGSIQAGSLCYFTPLPSRGGYAQALPGGFPYLARQSAEQSSMGFQPVSSVDYAPPGQVSCRSSADGRPRRFQPLSPNSSPPAAPFGTILRRMTFPRYCSNTL
jgi:hypothetical protein